MNYFQKAITLFILTMSVCTPVAAKDLHILIDASLSNPMLIDTAFNKRAATFAVQLISQLKQHDTVKLQTFGSLQSTDNFDVKALQVSRHNQKKVAGAVAGYLMSLPKTLKPQGSTNALAWFNRNSVDCSKDQHTILIVTDGIEASEYVNPNHLLSGKQALPAPSEFVNIRGCEVFMFGVGAGRLDQETSLLRKAWGQYFKQAGASFLAVPL
ncbi:hypothetical protein [Oceanobacter antarcticus]|uniref:VWFA domain-containing protein n=1 Tax=Oceanobacter antarcticus TaxID=3133425 RepID=A0ABW8NKE6_9GAMM